MAGTLKHNFRVGVEQEAALVAPEHRSGHEAVGIRECVPNYGLLGTVPSTMWALELSVEGFEPAGCGSKGVLVALDGLLDELWIHRYEVHEVMVDQGV